MDCNADEECEKKNRKYYYNNKKYYYRFIIYGLILLSCTLFFLPWHQNWGGNYDSITSTTHYRRISVIGTGVHSRWLDIPLAEKCGIPTRIIGIFRLAADDGEEPIF